MSQSPENLPNQSNDLSATWMEELKTLLGKKRSKKKLPALAGKMKDVADLVQNLLPKELDVGDSQSGDVKQFEKTYNQVHKILGDLKDDHDLNAFAGEYQSIVAAARDAKEEMSPTLLNLVVADLKEFQKKLEGYKKEFLSQNKKHEEALAHVSKEAVKGKKNDEAKLAKLNAEYGYYAQSILGNLEKLKQWSAEESDAFMLELIAIEQPLKTEKSAQTLDVAVSAIQVLENRVRQSAVYAQVTHDNWDATSKEVRKKIEDARSCLPLAIIKGYNERHAKICEQAAGDNEYLKAAVEMRQLRLEVEANSTESKRWQVIYKQLSDLCHEQVKQVDAIASPAESDQMRGEYFEARQFGMLYDFQPACERLSDLAPRMATMIEETGKAKETWANDKKTFAQEIAKRLQKEGLGESDPTRLKILADANMYYWMGDTQRAYKQAKDGLQGLIDNPLDAIRSTGDVNREEKLKAEKKANDFIEICVKAYKRVQEVVQALKASDSDAPPHVDALEKDYLSIRYSIDGPNAELLPEPALSKAIDVATKRLAQFNQTLDGILGDSDEAKGKLQGMKEQEAAWRIYEPLWKNWVEARKIAESFLDAFARVGGEKYLEFRQTFEAADDAANDAAAKFHEYLKMFPLSDKTRDKAQKLFGEVEQKLRQSFDALGGDLDKTGDDDNFRSQLASAAIQAQQKLEETLKASRKKLKDIVFDAKALADDEAWDYLPSFCRAYRDRGRLEVKEAEAFEKSTCPGAIDTAVGTVELIIDEFNAMLQNSSQYKEVGNKYHEIEKLLDDGDLKKCCPTKRAALKKQLKEEVRVDMGKVQFDQAQRQLATFEKQSLDPALAQANHIAKSREQGKELAARIEKLIKELAQKHQFPKGECGAYSDLLARRTEILKTTEDDEVAKQAVFSLTQLLDNLTKDSAQPGFVDKVKGQIQTRDKNLEERAKRIQAFENKLDTFLNEEYAAAKKMPKASKSALKMIRKTEKTARKLAQEGEFATAEEQLNTIKQLAADILGAPPFKPITNPKKFIENWTNTMGGVHSQLTALRNEIEAAVQESPETQGKFQDFQKEFGKLMDPLLAEFATESEPARTMSTALTTLGSEKATLSDMKRERERALAVLRHFKMMIGKNPLLKQLRKHPFDSKVALVGLDKMLNEIEYQVVVTT